MKIEPETKAELNEQLLWILQLKYLTFQNNVMTLIFCLDPRYMNQFCKVSEL